MRGAFTPGIAHEGNSKFEGDNDNEKDTSEKGIEAEHREAVDWLGQQRQSFQDFAPEDPVPCLVVAPPIRLGGERIRFQKSSRMKDCGSFFLRIPPAMSSQQDENTGLWSGFPERYFII